LGDDSTLVSINVAIQSPAHFITAMADQLLVQVTFTSSWYLINHPWQLSLAIPLGEAKNHMMQNI